MWADRVKRIALSGAIPLFIYVDLNLILVLAATGAAAGDYTGNVNFLLGTKTLDDGDWEPVESQGEFGALVRRNGITVFLSIELMLNAANLTLVAYSREIAEVSDRITGQMVVFFALAVAAAEAAVGLALFIAVYRQRETIDINRLNLMRW